MNSDNKELLRIINRVTGIDAAVISDRDGVAVVKASKESVKDQTLRPVFLSTAATTAEQASKLGIGRSRKCIAEYETHQVVNFYKNSFVVSVIASKSANTGLILSLDHLFDPIIDELLRVIRPE